MQVEIWRDPFENAGAVEHRGAKPDRMGPCAPKRYVAFAPFTIEKSPGLRPIGHRPLRTAVVVCSINWSCGRVMKISNRSHSMPVVFDAYGTLFNVHAAIDRHRDAAGH